MQSAQGKIREKSRMVSRFCTSARFLPCECGIGMTAHVESGRNRFHSASPLPLGSVSCRDEFLTGAVSAGLKRRVCFRHISRTGIKAGMSIGARPTSRPRRVPRRQTARNETLVTFTPLKYDWRLPSSPPTPGIPPKLSNRPYGVSPSALYRQNSVRPRPPFDERPRLARCCRGVPLPRKVAGQAPAPEPATTTTPAVPEVKPKWPADGHTWRNTRWRQQTRVQEARAAQRASLALPSAAP